MCRSSLVLALVVGALALLGGAEPARAAVGPCDAVGIPFVPDPAEKVCEEVTGAAGDVATDIAGDAARAITAPIFRQATAWVAGGAGWLVGRVGALMDATTTPHLENGWFVGQYRQMALLATALALPLLFLALLQSALSRNPAAVIRALTAVPVAFVLTGGAVAVVSALLAVTDWACQAISQQAGAHSREFFHDVATEFGKITESGGVPGAGAALFVAMLASLLAAFGAFAVWVELLIRSAGVYDCVLFFPAVLTARIWPRLERWTTRLAEALTALILSKFVIVATLSLAAGAMADSRVSQGFNGVLAGGALLILAAFAPMALFRLVQVADVQAHSRAGTAGTAVRGTQTTMSASQAARLAMDRQGAYGGLRTARAADMARTTTTAQGGGQGAGTPTPPARPAAREGGAAGVGRPAGGVTSVAGRALAGDSPHREPLDTPRSHGPRQPTDDPAQPRGQESGGRRRPIEGDTRPETRRDDGDGAS